MSIILTDEQERIKNEAVNWFRNSSSQLFQIDGPAGSGKTTLIIAILRALNLGPQEYMPMAYTGQAAVVMRTRGFLNAKSIHSSLYEVKDITLDDDDEEFNNIAMKFGRKPRTKRKFILKKSIDPKVRLFFIDEAYMIPNDMASQILKFGVKTIVCGDQRQLPPITGIPAFLKLGDSRIHHLTKIMRQAEGSPIIFLSQRAINQKPINCGLYGNSVLVITEDEFVPEMIGSANCMLCYTNETRNRMNELVRRYAGFAGPVPWYGERLVCKQNVWEEEVDNISLTNGLAGTIVSPMGPDCFDKHKKSFYIDFAPDVANGAVMEDIRVSYDYITANQIMKDEFKRLSRIDKKKFTKGIFFDFAYCMTVHSCQGSEYDHGIYFEERADNPNLNYTAITRFKKSLIYVKKSSRYGLGNIFYIPAPWIPQPPKITV